MTLAIEKKMDELDALEQMDNEHVAHAVTDILCELARAERIHPVWPGDTIHQVAIMMEEAGEAVQAANDVNHKGNAFKNALRGELIQCGAMVVRVLKNMEGLG